MAGHQGKSSLSTQKVRHIDTKYCRLPRIQQMGAQNRGKSGKTALDLGECLHNSPIFTD